MKRLVVLGGGVSGYGSAILAKRMGFETLLSERGAIADKYIKLLEEEGVEYEQGGHSEERVLSADEVVKSPGIPDSAPLVVELRRRGVAVISEIEFAGRYIGESRVICITGSNGKTTTTSLIYKILSDAGYDVALGGNIGESFAYRVATNPAEWYVLEISSFQLDGMFDFKADIAVLMNITPDHLDRYDYKFENYAASKMRVLQNQGIEDSFIYMEQDQTIIDQLSKMSVDSKMLPFSKSMVSSDGKITLSELTLDSRLIQIKGLHNLYNVMAASYAALAAGVEPERIRESIYGFAPVEHRLEPAGSIDGVDYINDSKATNVDSVWYALDAMTTPVVWIAGGTDKGNDYAPLIEFARAKVHTLICMGLDNGSLERSFGGVVPNIISTSSFEDAMEAARGAAHSGDSVLLSPACASFDLFKNYQHRGECFVEWVNRRGSHGGDE
ncbi:MAG: UDP-N-acetylmuramoyl-L-alanine--D-glutamate ligase [Rikenellaceae bacterium]